MLALSILIVSSQLQDTNDANIITQSNIQNTTIKMVYFTIGKTVYNCQIKEPYSSNLDDYIDDIESNCLIKYPGENITNIVMDGKTLQELDGKYSFNSTILLENSQILGN